MNLKSMVVTLSLCCASSMGYAQNIFPAVQQIAVANERIDRTKGFAIQTAKEADPVALEALKALITERQEGLKIYIGEVGDKSLKKYKVNLSAISGAYYLKTGANEIILIGYDDRGTFYGVQTLRQLLAHGQLPAVEITDYPEVLFRGSVEGFYGKPWSHRDRLSQLKFYGENKLNTYIYGPKDDPYHSSLSRHSDALDAGSQGSWRDPYPPKEAQQIRELAETAKKNKVDFVWAIHPGADIKWGKEEGEQDYRVLINKLEHMYELGVRSFAVFFDDINGEGTVEAHRQAALLNRIHKEFVKVKKDVTPLILCPTEYNKSWANPAPDGYLPVLGKELDPSIQVMWTGDRVCADITMETLHWINERINRPTYIWWNFPVTDYVRDRVLLGPSNGLATQATHKDMAGFVSNPMENAEASKIALFGVADYTWNPKSYQPNATWEEAVKVIMPEAPQAYRTFAIHTADVGKTGHNYRKDESWETSVIDPFNYTQADFDALKKEFESIILAAAHIKATTANPALVAELTPWLNQFEVLGERGLQTLNLIKVYERGDAKATREALLATEMTEEALRAFKAHKSGTLKLRPFIGETRTAIAAKLLSGAGVNPDSLRNSYAELISNVPQVANQAVQIDGNVVSINPMLEVIQVPAGGYFGIALPAGVEIRKVYSNLDIKRPVIEYASDGKNWSATKSQEMNYVRFINNTENGIEVKLNQFEVELTAPLNENAYMLILEKVKL